MRSRWMAAVTAVLMALALGACGGDEDKPAAKSDDGKPAKLSGSASVWIMDPGSPALQKVFKDYASEFQTKNAGSTVNVEFVPWGQAHDKFTTAIAGGKVPDAAEMGTTWTPEFAEQGAFTEVDQAASGKYVSSLVDAATLDGKVWGKPWYAGARGLIYRKDILEKAGVEPPTNWDEFKAAAAAIKKSNPDISPIGFTGLTEHLYLPMIWQAGGEIATQEGETWKSAINSPEGVAGIKYYADLYKEGYMPKASVGWEEPDVQEAFINGDIAMMIGGGWQYTTITDTKKELKDKIGTSLAPSGPAGKSIAFAGGSHLVVFKESKNTALATAFVDYMLEAENLNKFTSAIGFLPGTVDGIKASGYLEDEVKKPFAEQLLENSKVYPPSPRWGGLEGANIFDGEIQKVMKGQQTPEEAAKNMATKMDEEFGA